MIFYKEVVHTKPGIKPVCPYCEGTQFKPDYLLPLRYDFDIWFLFVILACSFTALILFYAGEILQNIVAFFGALLEYSFDWPYRGNRCIPLDRKCSIKLWLLHTPDQTQILVCWQFGTEQEMYEMLQSRFDNHL